jgi:hypothetical protein
VVASSEMEDEHGRDIGEHGRIHWFLRETGRPNPYGPNGRSSRAVDFGATVPIGSTAAGASTREKSVAKAGGACATDEGDSCLQGRVGDSFGNRQGRRRGQRAARTPSVRETLTVSVVT